MQNSARFSFGAFARQGEGTERKTIKEKYHAAGSPEPACPELVEGSKGRLEALMMANHTKE